MRFSSEVKSIGFKHLKMGFRPIYVMGAVQVINIDFSVPTMQVVATTVAIEKDENKTMRDN